MFLPNLNHSNSDLYVDRQQAMRSETNLIDVLECKDLFYTLADKLINFSNKSSKEVTSFISLALTCKKIASLFNQYFNKEMTYWTSRIKDLVDYTMYPIINYLKPKDEDGCLTTPRDEFFYLKTASIIVASKIFQQGNDVDHLFLLTPKPSDGFTIGFTYDKNKPQEILLRVNSPFVTLVSYAKKNDAGFFSKLKYLKFEGNPTNPSNLKDMVYSFLQTSKAAAPEAHSMLSEIIPALFKRVKKSATANAINNVF